MQPKALIVKALKAVWPTLSRTMVGFGFPGVILAGALFGVILYMEGKVNQVGIFNLDSRYGITFPHPQSVDRGDHNEIQDPFQVRKEP